jgi:L-histidine N-alpha-methyltransferase
VIQVAIHRSQYPEQVRADLLKSLRSRQIQHKFLYDSYKQAYKWLAVQEAHSPVRKHTAYRAIYHEAFAWVAGQFPNKRVHVIGLGCGGGQKDAALLERLQAVRSRSNYSAVDVSLPLVIMARLRATPFANETTGFVCDLEQTADIGEKVGREQRILTLFGIIPNSEPDVILPRVRNLLSDGDVLLMSANMAPGDDYRQGVKQVLPQYENAETTDWLLTFLYDLGVERGDGELKFTVEGCSSGLLRIRADFHFTRERAVTLGDESIIFARGDVIRLFYSYRYTPELLKRVLTENGLTAEEEWVADEEGVFAVKVKSRTSRRGRRAGGLR